MQPVRRHGEAWSLHRMEVTPLTAGSRWKHRPQPTFSRLSSSAAPFLNVGISLCGVAARIVEKGVAPAFGFLSRHSVGVLLKHVVTEALGAIVHCIWKARTSDDPAMTFVTKRSPEKAVCPVSDLRPEPLVLGWPAHKAMLNQNGSIITSADNPPEVGTYWTEPGRANVTRHG